MTGSRRRRRPAGAVSSKLRMTHQVQVVLAALLKDPAVELYGWEIAARTGLLPGAVYPILGSVAWPQLGVRTVGGCRHEARAAPAALLLPADSAGRGEGSGGIEPTGNPPARSATAAEPAVFSFTASETRPVASGVQRAAGPCRQRTARLEPPWRSYRADVHVERHYVPRACRPAPAIDLGVKTSRRTAGCCRSWTA